jgi:hypothetical protein
MLAGKSQGRFLPQSLPAVVVAEQKKGAAKFSRALTIRYTLSATR